MLFYYQEFVTKSYSSEDLGKKSMNKKLSQDEVTFLLLKIKSNGTSSIKTRTEQQKFTKHENYAVQYASKLFHHLFLKIIEEDDFQKNSTLLKRRRRLLF